MKPEDKPTRDMKRELVGTLAGHGARRRHRLRRGRRRLGLRQMVDRIPHLGLLRPAASARGRSGARAAYVFRSPLEAAADAAASGEIGEVLAALALVADRAILILGLVS